MKKKNYLAIYFIIIAVILVIIMFILPDDFFLKKYDNLDIPSISNNETIKKEFLDYEEQKDNLVNNNYNFEYNILDSMSDKTYEYKCQGTKEGTKYSGACTGAESITFTEETINSSFKINPTYLDLNNIFNLINNVEPELTSETESREYLYNVKIEDLDTEIIIYTDLYDINKIEISNGYMVYVLKYTRMS